MTRHDDIVKVVAEALKPYCPSLEIWNGKTTWDIIDKHRQEAAKAVLSCLIYSEFTLFKHGTFTSHSGLTLPDKIDCDALTEEDWDAVARWFAARLTFSKVIGIPAGGLPLAKALEAYKADSGPVLIVDDVLTTGRSMEEARREHPGAIGAVLFSRTMDVREWITARFIEAAPVTEQKRQ